MISTLSKQGVCGFTYGVLRTFDAWGAICRGAQTGDPKGRYCANLGHKQDDESGPVYMRARYYEPLSGRFTCEDPSRNGSNFFSYRSGDPVNVADQNGKSTLAVLCLILAIFSEIAAWLYDNAALYHATAIAGIVGSLIDLIMSSAADASKDAKIDSLTCQNIMLENQILNSPEGIAAQDSLAGPAVDAFAAEDGELLGMFICMDLDDND